MRFYAFVNAGFLSPIQCGIQAGHVAVEMGRTFCKGNEGRTYADWADNHKTMIVLAGGNHLELSDLFDELSTLGEKLNLPVEIFVEDETQNFLNTAVGIVVPESIYGRSYDASPFRGPSNHEALLDPEWQLFEIIKSKRLA